VSGDRDFKFGR